jgi:TPR repeat protein
VNKLLSLMALTIGIFFLCSNAVWAEDAPETKAMKDACEKGDGRACYKIGERYRTVELDNKNAVPYYEKACKDNYLAGCNAAGILTQLTGKQYSPQWKKAAKFFAIGCDVDDHVACSNLGQLKYKEGRQSAAKKYWKKSCDLGNQVACSNYERINR